MKDTQICAFLRFRNPKRSFYDDSPLFGNLNSIRQAAMITPLKQEMPYPSAQFASHLNQQVETQRLSLEPLMAAHADLLYDSLCDERIYKWIDAGGPKDIDRLRSKWQRNESRLSPDGREVWLNWAIRSKETGSYIGKLDAELDSPINVTNIGFVFFPEYWGNGYATESLLAIISFLSINGIFFIRATVATPNIASSNVLMKAGFTRGELVPDERDTYEYNLKISKH